MTDSPADSAISSIVKLAKNNFYFAAAGAIVTPSTPERLIVSATKPDAFTSSINSTRDLTASPRPLTTPPAWRIVMKLSLKTRQLELLAASHSKDWRTQ